MEHKFHRLANSRVTNRLALEVMFTSGLLVSLMEKVEFPSEKAVSWHPMWSSLAHLTTTGKLNCFPIMEKISKNPLRSDVGVWIGFGAMIAPGVVIGDGAIVGMGSVVTRSVDSGEVVGGNPAKPISKREQDGFVEKAVQQELYYLKKEASVIQTRKSS